MMEMRICNKCKQSKSLDKFGLRKDLGYKPLRICKSCINAAALIRKRKAKDAAKQIVPKKDPEVLLPPYRPPFLERPIYVPPKWGR